ncbi:Acyltransferase-like protein [Gracilariopsis chorda]|uniref:Acyltransferase-like protein n=1 Tax=Gracilariopsis chorda TaxID=448386 RepID=A0A2V3J754_9FLOR|nr:Acyltransferase-like protein [Gracilariopsis chorda]|eukprot:PXF49942.1 Acyltransferase-like protein [Gracilariopsis chorda]
MSRDLCFLPHQHFSFPNSRRQSPLTCAKRAPKYVSFTPRILSADRRAVWQCAIKNGSSPLVLVEDAHNPTPLLEPQKQMSPLPVLMYIAGLDARPLPESQCEKLRERYAIVSIYHAADDRSDWDDLVNSVLPSINIIRGNSDDITLMGESFGAALALRLVAAAAFSTFRSLVLLNSGTALSQQRFLREFTHLLPLLQVDTTGKVLYKMAAIILFKALLTREDLLDERNLPPGNALSRSIDIDRIPIPTLLHRIQLLRGFDQIFSDSCLSLVSIPTLLVASRNDRLLNSVKEARRLSALLPNVSDIRILYNSEHAALWERDVNLLDVLVSHKIESPNKNRSSGNGVPNSPEGNGIPSPSRRISVRHDQSEKRYNYENAIEEGRRIFEPWRKAVSPKVLGKSNVIEGLAIAEKDGKNRPVLFVGNHGILGILDTSLLYLELLDILKGQRIRSLADPIHFGLYSEVSDGKWENFIKALGAVRATPLSFYRLLSAGDRILLFPGGAREVCRRRGERNLLVWDTKTDFLRPAAKFNAIIVPFSSVGADDSVEIVVDGQELLKVPLIGGRLREFLKKKKLSTENLMPVSTFPPQLDRFYFKFHKPIDTESVDSSDIAACRDAYSSVRGTVEDGINELIRERERDAERRLTSRLVRRLTQQTSGPPNPQGMILGSFLDFFLPSFEL